VAINKARTSPWMKTFIIILIVAFVSSFMYAGFAGLFTSFSQSANTTQSQVATNTVQAVNDQYKPGVDALAALVQSQPTSYTALVNLGNAYYDWAQTLSTPSQGASQPTTAAMAAAFPLWGQASEAYGRALKVKPGEPPVTVDYSIATFYSGDTTAAIVAVTSVTKSAPTFAPAWLNLGIFLEQAGETSKAIAAYQQYLKLDPNGQNVSFAKQQLTALQGSSVVATTAP
jgi:Flp pilus assembly protein TadD